jgi:hypothetical protein
MGKSHLLDEFSKRHFLIPINLREKGSQGVLYPSDSLSPSCPDERVS